MTFWFLWPYHFTPKAWPTMHRLFLMDGSNSRGISRSIEWDDDSFVLHPEQLW